MQNELLNELETVLEQMRHEQAAAIRERDGARNSVQSAAARRAVVTWTVAIEALELAITRAARQADDADAGVDDMLEERRRAAERFAAWPRPEEN